MKLLWKVFHICLLVAVLESGLCVKSKNMHNEHIQTYKIENVHRLMNGETKIPVKEETTLGKDSPAVRNKTPKHSNKGKSNLSKAIEDPLGMMGTVHLFQSLADVMKTHVGMSSRDLLKALERLHDSHRVIKRKKRQANSRGSQMSMSGGAQADFMPMPGTDVIFQGMGGVPKHLANRMSQSKKKPMKAPKVPSVNSQTKKKTNNGPKVVHLKHLSLSELKYLLQRATTRIRGHINRKEAELKKKLLAQKKKLREQKRREARLKKQRKAELRRQKMLARRKKAQERAQARKARRLQNSKKRRGR